MDRKLPMFVWGAVGALVFYGLLLGRNWDTLSHLGEVTGGPKGMVIAIAGCVLVSAVTGLLTILVQPTNVLGAILFGLVPPALLAVGSLPRLGVPDLPHGKPLKDSLGEKTKPFAVWTALNPVATFADLRTDRALAESAGAHKREMDTERTEFERKEREAARVEREAEAAKAKADLDAAVAAGKQASEAAATKARAEAEAAARAVVEAARAEAEEARARLKESQAQTQKYATEVTALQQRLATAATAGPEVSTLKDEIARLKAQAAKASAQVKAAATVAADLERVAGWYQAQPANSGARLINLCGAKLRDRDPAARASACRLLAFCGADAKSLLERALGDSDASVAEAALSALDKLGE